VSPPRSPNATVTSRCSTWRFADAADFWLVCPYDTSSLPQAVIEEAERSHPLVAQGGQRRENERYAGLEHAMAAFVEPLSPRPRGHTSSSSTATRSERCARSSRSPRSTPGLASQRADDLVLAVHEVGANSVVHGGGRGVLLIWREADWLVCEVRDAGRIDWPLAGRERPDPLRGSGSGLWLANQLCDLVQIRTFPDGNAVRLHMQIAQPGGG
jgi:anti-sigma regulatory factor (Ser/Thr protein kinase)